MVCGEPIDEKTTWAKLTITSLIRSQFDEGQNLPELNNEWLSPDELSLKQREQEREQTPTQSSPLDGIPDPVPGEPPDFKHDNASSAQRETNEETPCGHSPASEGATHGGASHQSSPRPEETVPPTSVDHSHQQPTATGSAP